MKKIKFYIWPFIVFLVLILAGFTIYYYLEKKANQSFYNQLVWTSNISIAAVNPDRISRLSDLLPQDISKTDDYVRVKEQIIDLGKLFATQGIDSVYFITQKDNTVIFIAESNSDGTPVMPGSVYRKAPPEALAALNGKQPTAIARYSDEYGTYLSRFTPVFDKHSGKQVGVLGIDVQNSYYQAQALKLRIIFLIFGGLSCVFIILLFLYFKNLYRLKDESQVNEEKIRAISNSISDGVVVINSESKVIFWNKASEKIFGFSSGKALGAKFTDLVKMRDVFNLSTGQVVANLDLSPSNYVVGGANYVVSNAFEFKLKNDNKDKKYYELSITITEINKEKHLVGIFHNISSRKEEQIALEKQKNELEKLNNLMIGRELKMVELKKEIADIKHKTI